LLALAPVAAPACAISEPGAPEEVTEVTHDLTSSSSVLIQPVNITPDVLADWGENKQLSQAMVGDHTLRLRYCKFHFPGGSQALANLTTAINTYSNITGVSINVTDIAAAADTKSHPDLDAFTLPANAIYVDYGDVGDNYAGTKLIDAACDGSSPRQCTQARLLVTEDSPAFTDPMVVDTAPSVGVFMHELGHAFGMAHINEDDDHVTMLSPADMAFARTTIHGKKIHAEDFRSNVIQAGTLGFLLATYPATGGNSLATDEIVAHRNMSLFDATAKAPGHIEWNPSKTFTWGTASSLIEDLNEVKLRWHPFADGGDGRLGAFEPCAWPGTLPKWHAQMSETSTNTTDKLFQAVFEVSNSDDATAWSQVAVHSFDSYAAGEADLRQIDWEQTFPLPAAAFGLPSSGVTAMTRRKLRFRADSSNALTERGEGNNEWWVSLCLYPSSDTACSSPSTCEEP
jgi:hypothetical protein